MSFLQASWTRRTLLSASLLVLSISVHSQTQPVGKAPPTYKLLYRVVRQELTGSKKLTKGTYELDEDHGSLYAAYTEASLKRLFLFNGRSTLSISDPASATYCKGFNMNLNRVQLYLPMNFAASPIFEPLEDWLESMRITPTRRKTLRNRGARIAVSMGSDADTGATVFSGGDLSYMPGDLKGSLEVGFPNSKISTTQYSEFKAIGSVRLPQSIVLLKYGPTGKKSGPFSFPVRKLTFTLASSTANPSEVKVPSFEDVLRQGMFVTNVDPRAGPDVIYDPARGSFESQASAEFDKRLAARELGRPGRRSSYGLQILMAAFVAVLALFFQLRKR